MPSKVFSAAVVGVEAFEVEIEVHAGWGNTDKIAVVGLPDTAVKESKDRMPVPTKGSVRLTDPRKLARNVGYSRDTSESAFRKNYELSPAGGEP